MNEASLKVQICCKMKKRIKPKNVALIGPVQLHCCIAIDAIFDVIQLRRIKLSEMP